MADQTDARQIGIGTLRLEIEGLWSVRGYAKFLRDLDSAYLRLNAFLKISEEFDRLIIESLEPTPYAVEDDFVAADRPITYRVPRRGFGSLVTSARRRTSDLKVASLSLSSPGWVEVLGSWNPLKVIADFVTQWRAENTNRLKIIESETTKRMEIEEREKTKRLQIKMPLAKMLMERLDELSKLRPPEMMDRFVEFTLGDAQRRLIGLSKDSRVKEVSASETR